MAFWGIEVKPNTPYVHRSDDERGRLHVSQATLGDGSASKKSILQCKVGDKKPVYLCSLLPKRLETCQLNIELGEDDEVTFSIVGTHSVHLSGFFYGDSEDQDYHGHDCGDDSCDHNVMVSDFEDEDDSEDDDDDDDDYSDDGFEMYTHSPVHNSGVRIEEIVDEEKTNNENDSSKRKKRKKTDENPNRQIVAISASQKKIDTSPAQTKLGETNGEKTQKKSDAVHGNKLKRKIGTVDQDGKPARETIEQRGSAVPTDTIILENIEVIKKKKKKNKEPESGATPSANVKSTDENGLVKEKQEKKEAKSLKVRTYPNGLVIEKLVIGKPDGKRASRGEKVRVHYIGKLLKNGKIFDSNVGKAPFQFRLGIGKVIKGWDVGVQGMRVGDKRRLTIPPSLGYGAKGAGMIPPNAWLVFDVDLVGVK